MPSMVDTKIDDRTVDRVEEFEAALRHRLGTSSGMSLDEYDCLLDVLEGQPGATRLRLLSILGKAQQGLLAYA